MSIHCAVALRDESGMYHKYSYTMLLSCFENTSSALHLHLLCDEMLEPNRHLFHELCARYGHELTFHRVPQIDLDILQDIPPHLGPGTLYRCFLPDLIPENKVIYLDSDLIFERDIADLDAINLGQACCGAVADSGVITDNSRKYKAYFSSLGLRKEAYFNAGVLSLNLERIRSRWNHSSVLFAELRKLQAQNTLPRLLYWDQDLLNALFTREDGDVVYLDESFNYSLRVEGRTQATLDELKGKIVHFIGAKPFAAFYPAHLVF